MKPAILALLVLISSFAVSAQTEFIRPEGLAPANGYSHVVVASQSKLVFIAGQVATNAKGELVGKDNLRAQAEQVFANLQLALKAAGGTLGDITKLTMYIKGYKPEDLAIIREVRAKYLTPARLPASTLIGVTSLAAADYLIE